MSEISRPRRPVYRDPSNLDAAGGGADPTTALHAAHETAAALLHAGQANHDPATTQRLIALTDEIGLDTLAELWSRRPARSLPGVLWRLYLLREWMVTHPEAAARDYHYGIPYTEPHHVIAGVDPPGPDEVRTVADRILRGAFTGDFAIALERAASFCYVVVAGRAAMGTGTHDVLDAARLRDVADDLAASAKLWRAGRLT